MASGARGAWQQDLGVLFDAGSLTGLPDGDLLERFSVSHEHGAEAAFEALVKRHGPMVLRVCRNVLSNPDDAEDAFQATFLVLVKQRSSIRKLDSVASWLYGVAARVSARARVDAVRRRKIEQAGIRLAAGSTPDSDEGLEREAFGPQVQNEVRRLPEKYQSVVLLCYWEGLTHEQAAARLGCPIGTVRSRIARRRDLLRRRLVRRGLISTASAVALALDPSGAHAAVSLSPVPPGLVQFNVKAATRIAAGQATAEEVSAGIAELVQRILWSMAMTKLMKLSAFGILSIPFLLGGLAWAQRAAQHDREARARPATRSTAEKRVSDTRSSVDLAHKIEPPDLLLVEVLEALPGRPISGERLVRPDGKISLGFYGDVYVAGLTLPEAKEKIVTHLKKYLSDEVLGLIEIDPETGKPFKNDIAPRDSDRVFVEVSAYNSRHIYIMGAVVTPGRFPFTGSDRVLDVIHYAGGLLPDSDRGKIKLIRTFPRDSPHKVLPIDYEEITMGTDSTTNYEILPFDRIVVPKSTGKTTEKAPDPETSSTPNTIGGNKDKGSDLYFDRTMEEDGQSIGRGSLRVIERRFDRLEKTLNAILERLDAREKREPGGK